MEDMAAATLTAEGPRFELPDSERRQLLGRPVLTDLSRIGLICARGADMHGFLNGQLTADVGDVLENQSQISGYCNPKGRLLAVFRVFRQDGDAYHLTLPLELLEPTLKRLRMYVLRAKVELDDAGEELARFGYSGPDVDRCLHSALGDVPVRHDQATLRHGVTAIRLRGPVARFELHGPLTEMEALWTRLSPGSLITDSAHWRLLDILAGVPNVFAQTVGFFVPQMVNLDLLGGVSFTKGCYTGQEIVARTHYLGKLKRRMYRIHINADSPPPPGTAVYTSDRGTQPVGTLVDAQPAPRGGTEALAVLQMDCTNQDLHLGEPEGEMATRQDLPYSLDG